MFRLQSNAPAVCVAIVLTLCCAFTWAATPAGTIISNQASAIFKDENGNEYTVTSNVVETVIEQVSGLALTQDQQQLAAPGGTVNFSHRISNTGNGDDRFTLQLSNANNGSVNLNSLAIFPDIDQNGIADNSNPINETPWVAAGTDLYVVVEGVVPATASANDTAVIELTAISQFDTAVIESNTDTVNVDAGAIVVFTKSINSAGGISPSGPYTVTLNFQNVGSEVANEVTLIDALPEGMNYVAGSGQWNLTQSALSDNDPLDYHTGGSTRIRYCAYHNTCSNLPEAQVDSDLTSSNQVTAIIETVQPGEAGFVSFDIEIAPQLPSGVLNNLAEMQFDSGGATQPRTFSNTVGFTVLPTASVVANGSQATPIDGMNEPVLVNSAPLAGTVEFENIIWNTGNTVDTFNIEVDVSGSSFPVGTVYHLLKADAATPLSDTNQDGAVDTGPIQPGQFAIVVMQLHLPFGVSGNNGGTGFDIRKIARSVTDTTVFNDVTDHLNEIVSNQVDLTNQAPAGMPGALGGGPGPEAQPVSTATIDASGTVTFDLYVRHQGDFLSSYVLDAFADPNGGALPLGWSVQFTDVASGQTISQTASLASGESQHILATVNIPNPLQLQASSIYFQVQSPQNGASDIKHDAIDAASVAELTLTPNLNAQVSRGGSIVYEHVINNTGNVTLNDIQLSVLNSVSTWNSTLYADTDLNGFLSPADLPVNAPLNLLAGEAADLFLKVFAPATAGLGQSNISTLTAVSSGASSVTATDVTTVSESQVGISKEQAVDTGCDGIPDAGSDFGQGHIDVAPGNNCILYRLTATNHGVNPSYNVTIHDYTPPYTLYYPSAVCSRSPCWINEPGDGETGTIKAETDQLQPGASYFLQFSVRVE